MGGIIKGLAKPNAYETRWDKKTRPDAEAAAAAEAAEDAEPEND